MRKLGSVVESLQRALGSTVLWHGTKTQDPGVFQNNKPIDVAILPLSIDKGQGKDDFETLAAEIKKNMQRAEQQQGAVGADLLAGNSSSTSGA
jgi:hypothetical protein